MEFRIENIGPNISVSLLEEGEQVAKAICYFKDTPKVQNKNIGCIGDLEIKTEEAGIQIIKKCEEVLKEKDVKLIAAPMNGNTWKKYRTMKYTSGESLFLLENVDPIEYNAIFKAAGFKELYTYTSTKGLIENAYHLDSLEIIEENVKRENIKIRKLSKENCLEDLRKIYNVSKSSFTRNPFYTPIDEDDFLKQYEPYISMVDEDLILIAEKEGKEIGFVFCIPNFNEIKEGKELKTLILKTIAVLPEYEYLAIRKFTFKPNLRNSKTKGFCRVDFCIYV